MRQRVNNRIARWFLIAFVANIVAPQLFPYGMAIAEKVTNIRTMRLSMHLGDCWMGWLFAEVAIAALLGALVDAPLKHRLLVSCVAAFVLIFAMLFGMEVAIESLQMGRNGFGLGVAIAGLGCYTLGFLSFTMYRALYKRMLSSHEAMRDPYDENSPSKSRQISVEYLFVAMTLFAIALTLVNAVVPEVGPSLNMELLTILLAGMVIAFLMSLIVVAALQAVLTIGSIHNSKSAYTLSIMLVTFPLMMMFGICQLTQLAPRADIHTYIRMYLFFFGFVGSLLLVLMSFRRAGLRLVRS